MFVKQFKVGGDRNFAYIAADEINKYAAIIDPSYSPQLIIDYAREQDFDIKYIFNTHGHSDHTNGNDLARQMTGIKPLAYGEVHEPLRIRVIDETIFPMGNLEIKIIHTPGHTADSICIYIGDALFTGDTLFVGKVGGTDYGQQARSEYDSLHNKLMKLPDNTRILPGHDYGVEPESTILHERQTNPFLLQSNFESFLDLKKNWTEYKAKHGID